MNATAKPHLQQPFRLLSRLLRSLSVPLNIYPNIVNMLGQMTVDVNGMCLDPSTTYVLMIEQREVIPSNY